MGHGIPTLTLTLPDGTAIGTITFPELETTKRGALPAAALRRFERVLGHHDELASTLESMIAVYDMFLVERGYGWLTRQEYDIVAKTTAEARALLQRLHSES